MGRPTKYTPIVVKKIYKLLAQGNSRRNAALGAGVSEDSFGRWLVDHEEFAEVVERAEAEAISSRVGILTDSIKASYAAKDYATAGRLSIEYLKRKDRENWGDNVVVDVDRSIADIAARLGALAAAEKDAAPIRTGGDGAEVQPVT